MFEKLGHGLVRRRKSVLAIFIVALIGLGVLAGLAVPRLSGGGYSNPNSDSAKATKYLINTFHVHDPAVILEVKSTTSITDPAVVASALALEKQFRQKRESQKHSPTGVREACQPLQAKTKKLPTSLFILPRQTCKIQNRLEN